MRTHGTVCPADRDAMDRFSDWDSSKDSHLTLPQSRHRGRHMSRFRPMYRVVPKGSQGCAEVTHYEITKLDAMRDSWHGIPTEPGKVAILKVYGVTVMSD